VSGDRLSPRSRHREQTRTEIKEVTLRQLAEGGTAAVALPRIAKEAGLSGPRWMTTQPLRCLPIEGRPAPVYTTPPDTLDSARA
jgi:hypothetical protein